MTQRTLTYAELAQVDYALRIIDLDEHARALADAGYALQSRVVRHQSAILFRAARAEQVDPEPRVAPCSVCHGVRSCDRAAHLEGEE